uniref:Kinase n=1 Tax=Sinocyclocheilus grahami TaxID=75366 RepID=A0A672QEI7_SINGR
VCTLQTSMSQGEKQLSRSGYLGKGVLLEPFVHQVGGHSCVLRFGEQTICKPLIPREHQFYKSLPAAMRKFTPQYRGVVSVSFEEDEEGNLCLLAYPLHSELGDLENVDPLADLEPNNKIKWVSKMLLDNEGYSKDRSRHARKDKDKSCNLSVRLTHLYPHPSSVKREEELEWLKQTEVFYYSLERSNAAGPQLKHNPWSLKCHQQHLQRMKDNAKHRNQYKFILLENLTWRYTVPCVLDLKMGTRQHGDDASEEKKAVQIRKCQQSTSASIGVRLCGMQHILMPYSARPYSKSLKPTLTTTLLTINKQQIKSLPRQRSEIIVSLIVRIVHQTKVQMFIFA